MDVKRDCKKIIYVDEMLNDVSKWMRLFGVPNIYLKNKRDRDIKNIIKINKSFVLLTSDKKLARSLKSQAIYINIKDSIEKKLSKIFKLLSITPSNSPLCSLCGNNLVFVEKNSVIGKVPEKVFLNNDIFYYCNHCDKYYWKGGHWKNINKIFKQIISNLKS